MNRDQATNEVVGNLVVSGQSPAQASVAPSPLHHQPPVPLPVQHEAYVTQPPPEPMEVKHETPEPAKQIPAVVTRLPIVKLDRMNLEVSETASNKTKLIRYPINKNLSMQTLNFFPSFFNKKKFTIYGPIWSANEFVESYIKQ